VKTKIRGYILGQISSKVSSTVSGAALVLGLALATSGAANASTVTSISGGTILPFSALNILTSGPEAVALGVTWSSDVNSAYGWTGSSGFVSNGNWSGNPPHVALNSITGNMTFSFSTPVSAVGGILNWAVHGVLNYGSPSISVYDSSHTLIESLLLSSNNLNLVAPNSFYGFQESTANISYFVLTDGYIGLRDLTVGQAVATTPLPAALPLFATGLGALGLLGWLRKRKAALAA
jgi:hypothetical protein